MALHHNPRIVTDGLEFIVDAADRNSYVSGSTSWYDLSGNGYTGTLTNGPTFDSTNRGTIVFDGVDDRAIFTPYEYSDLTQHTALVVFRTPNINQGWGEIFQKGQRRDFRIRTSAFGGTDIDMAYRINTGGSTYDLTYDFNPAQPDTWYVAHMTIDTNAGGSARFFINDEKKAELAITSSVTLSETTDPLYDGELEIGSMSRSTEYFLGEVPYALMYNRALTDEEMIQNFNAIRSRFGI